MLVGHGLLFSFSRETDNEMSVENTKGGQNGVGLEKEGIKNEDK